MSRKGFTLPMSDERRRKIARRKSIKRLIELKICREFYYNNREDYTYSELDTLEEAVKIQQVALC